MMACPLFSLAAEAPPHFQRCSPTKRELLAGPCVLYALELESACGYLDGLLSAGTDSPGERLPTERVTGLLATPGSQLRFVQLGAVLWHVSVPAPLLSQLHLLGEFIATRLEAERKTLAAGTLAQLELKRSRDWITLFRRNYQQTTDDAVARIAELQREHELRLLAEESLRQTEKMRVVGQLAGGVAHDFNNILAGILGAAELLSAGAVDEEARQLSEMIVRAAEQAAGLTKRLLAFTSSRSFPIRAVSLHQVLEHVSALLARSVDKRVRVRLLFEAEQFTVAGDGGQLESLFLNLGINAAQAMPQGGELEFRTSLVSFAESGVTSSGLPLVAGRYVQVTVTDTGGGIEEQVLSRIFEPFFTTKAPGKGTGLGLAAVYSSVREHGGSIEVQSLLGTGTSFRVWLPLDESARPESQAPPGSLARGEETILVIDDEPMVRVVARHLLERLGYSVLEAEDGTAGLASLREHAGSIALVLLDMVMPAMNGTECFHALRAILPELKVVMMSGYVRDQNVVELQARGLAGFLHKPFHLEDLSAAVRDALSLTEPAD